MHKSIYIKLILSAFFWGSSAIAGKIAMEDFIPSVTTFSRFFIAALILFIYVFSQKAFVKLTITDHIKLMILGFIGVTLCYYFYFQGLFLSSAFNAGLIEATIPLLTLFFAILIKEEAVDIQKSSGFILAYLGVFIIIAKMDIRNIIHSSYNLGDVLLLLSTLFFAIYNILIKKFHLKGSFLIKTAYIFLYGSLALLPWVFYDIATTRTLYQIGGSAHLISVTSLLFMAVGGSVLAYIFFNQGIHVIGASAASSFINLVPCITLILSIFILGEKPIIYQWIGAFIIFAGVILANRKRA